MALSQAALEDTLLALLPILDESSVPEHVADVVFESKCLFSSGTPVVCPCCPRLPA